MESGRPIFRIMRSVIQYKKKKFSSAYKNVIPKRNRKTRKRTRKRKNKRNREKLEMERIKGKKLEIVRTERQIQEKAMQILNS